MEDTNYLFFLPLFSAVKHTNNNTKLIKENDKKDFDSNSIQATEE